MFCSAGFGFGLFFRLLDALPLQALLLFTPFGDLSLRGIESGAEVLILLPGLTNHRLVAWAAQTHIRPLLEAGCRVWRSPPPFDHSKLMTVDGEWSLIGSPNWDIRSLRLNFELAVEIYDPGLAARLAEIVDARCAQPITLEDIDQRRFMVKLRDAAARLCMPYI